uniref:Uncharacterized protein n=1 Tax=Rhizophora mucronata TaxID=61149 RepID=A0A2P2J1E4_RHIMU
MFSKFHLIVMSLLFYIFKIDV